MNRKARRPSALLLTVVVMSLMQSNAAANAQDDTFAVISTAEAVKALATSVAPNGDDLENGTPGARLIAVQVLRDLVVAQPDKFGALSSRGSEVGPDSVVLHLVGEPAGEKVTPDRLPGEDVRQAFESLAAQGIEASLLIDPLSLVTLQSIMEDIPQTYSTDIEGGRIVRYGIDTLSNRIEVGVPSALVDSFSGQLQQRYGGAAYVVAEDLVAENSTDRRHDLSAFWGGDLIKNLANKSCTSGFGITDSNGHKWTTITGHCGPEADGGPTLGRWKMYGTGVDFGNLHFNRYNSTDKLDSALIDGYDYEGKIWTHGPYATNSVSVRGAVGTCVGCYIYFDGAVNGQQTVQVLTDPGCWTVDGLNTCFVQRADSTTDSATCQQGNSGGPVMAPDGAGRVFAQGLVHAYLDGNDSARFCLFVNFPRILAVYSSTVRTAP